VGELQWGPNTAPTKEQHDAIVAMRGRPFTDDGMRPAKTESDAGDPDVATGSIIDRVIANARRGSK
jgi:hypothetical protein